MWKALIIFLLLVLSLSKYTTVKEAIKSMQNDPNYIANGYKDVPVQPLDKLHSFIDHILQINYPQLKKWELINIKEKYSNVTDQTIYIFTYVELEKFPDNITYVINSSSIVVIGHQKGTLFSIFEKKKIVATFAKPENLIVGGFTVVDKANLDQIQTNALKFILDKISKLSGWVLIQVKTQIVAGENNCFTFKDPKTNNTKTYCVYSRPWENNYMELTLDDGTKVTSGGVVSEAGSSNTAQTPSAGPSTGGFTVVDAAKLNQVQTNALNFILKNLPVLKGWTLIEVKNQIVSGQNNCFTFKDPKTSKTKTYCVYSIPWENNYMELTLDDGTKVTSGGVDNNLTSQPTTSNAVPSGVSQTTVSSNPSASISSALGSADSASLGSGAGTKGTISLGVRMNQGG